MKKVICKKCYNLENRAQCQACMGTGYVVSYDFKLAGPIVKAVCAIYAVTPEELLSNSRKRSEVEARSVLYYLCRESLPYSPQELGDVFGKDRSSIVRAAERMNQNTDDRILKRLMQIKQLCSVKKE